MLAVINFALKIPTYYNNVVIITHALSIISKYFIYNVIPLIRQYKRTVKKTIFISICDILID